MYMNQTKKRLSIINLAISITDIETIQLQILKLGLLKSDNKIQEIIAVLQAENYAKAQRLIKVYIDTPIEEILQRASQNKMLDIEELTPSNHTEKIISNEDQKIIDEFQLFTTGTDNWSKKKKEIDINDYITDISPTPNKNIDTQAEDFSDPLNFDALLNIKADDVMSDNIELDISQDPNDAFFDLHAKEEKVTLHTESIGRDTFFDIEEREEIQGEEIPADDPFETLLTIKTDTKTSLKKQSTNKQALQDTALRKQALQETALKKQASIKSPPIKRETTQKPISSIQKNPLEEILPKKPKNKVIPENYPAISYIRQKFVSMKKQYEPIQKVNDRFPTVETFLTKISQDGYREKEIEQTLGYVEKLITEEKFAEAAQLLLLCASTESKFAQLILARELYRGILLRKKVSEAFTLLSHLSDDNFPDALCDLGQFHENGIGTNKDKKIAKELYKKAMNLGIKRAEKHYARLNKQSKGFFNK